MKWNWQTSRDLDLQYTYFTNLQSVTHSAHLVSSHQPAVRHSHCAHYFHSPTCSASLTLHTLFPVTNPRSACGICVTGDGTGVFWERDMDNDYLMKGNHDLFDLVCTAAGRALLPFAKCCLQQPAIGAVTVSCGYQPVKRRSTSEENDQCLLYRSARNQAIMTRWVAVNHPR